jgi:sugar phosphate isomerase/epimerase
MKLGAQFYSIRTECTTPEALYSSMKKIKEIGYDIIQISGVCDIEAERLKAYSDELALPITCTHKPYASIVEDTDNLIAYHKIIGSPVIGLGSMPGEFRTSIEGCRAFMDSVREPIKKINDAGLTFTYHNHSFEFDPLEGTNLFELLFEELPEAHFLPDVYWIKHGGYDPYETLDRICKAGRVTNVHFKDMKTEPRGEICPCGAGVIDFAPIAKLLKSHGIENVLVEQDNAPMLGDVFAQMKQSYDHLDKIVHI